MATARFLLWWSLTFLSLVFFCSAAKYGHQPEAIISGSAFLILLFWGKE